MLHNITRLIAVALTATILMVPAYADADDQKEARLLLLEARQLVDKASPGYRRSEDLAYLQLWEQARDKIRELLDKYPTTDEGMALANGEKVHGITVTGLDTIIRTESVRVNSLTTWNACKSGAIDLNDPSCRRYKSDIAIALGKEGNIEQALEILYSLEDPRKTYAQLSWLAFHYTSIHPSQHAVSNRLILDALAFAESNELLDTTGHPYEILVGAFRDMTRRLIENKNFDLATTYANSFPVQERRDKELHNINYFKRHHEAQSR